MPPFHPDDWPPEQGWLTKERVQYFQSLLTLAFLLIAIPWALMRIITSPITAARNIARARVGVT